MRMSRRRFLTGVVDDRPFARSAHDLRRAIWALLWRIQRAHRSMHRPNLRHQGNWDADRAVVQHHIVPVRSYRPRARAC